MGTYNGRINHGVFVVGILGQMLKNPLPDATPRPAAETGMHHPEIAEAFGQITPWNAGPIAIQNRLDKQTVIVRRTTYRSLPAR
jgi:hypothetical protein